MSNDLVSMNLNGVEYYYVRNAQGDIIGLIDGSGTQVVSYTYDSWGKLISVDGALKDSVGVKNPYRYRGYRYDTDTSLYYLNSRYYNPEFSRMLNSDDTDVLDNNVESLTDKNLFTYCDNNSINRSDEDGYFWETILDIGSIGWSANDFIKKPSWGNAGYLAWDVAAAALPFVPGSYVAKGAKIINGNSKASKALQHGYEIFEKKSKGVVKTGVSGGVLNKNGTSRRANAQVNKWNKESGYKKYDSRVVVKNIPGRDRILKWEKMNADRLRLNHPMTEHKRP